MTISINRLIFAISAIAVAIPLLANTVVAQDETKPTVLSQATIQPWAQHIKPTEDELAWTKIDWLPDLKSGIEKASKDGKPILLWTMNGHPFGCT